ncbi:cell division protein ZipA [Salinimonas marina]|uniref:Cell division protein ZipA n=1 Tax=Salinimonas marina TaxID=2785918 RepID=A0A7S9HCE8_9ALTE|nr:cell division protein ZipA [Salinimonas marina]QPG04366.1 cell division protein ZipA [Salinimonas marina]
MEDELRLSLLIVGTIIIIAVLAHGIWKIRKNSGTATRRQRVEPGQWDEAQYQDNSWQDNSWQDHPRSDDTAHDFDDLGIGKVRVVGGDAAAGEASTAQDNFAATDSASVAADEQATEQKLYGSVVSNPKPHMQRSAAEASDEDKTSEPVPEPPGFLLKDNPEAGSDVNKLQEPGDRFSAQDPAGYSSSSRTQSEGAEPAEKAADKATERPQTTAASEPTTGQHHRPAHAHADTSPQPGERREPNFGADPAADSGAGGDHHVEAEQDTSAKKPTAEAAAGAQEVLVLNVRAKDEQPISGAALLPMLLTLGFKFGEQDIFHRHISADGNGPVLFSLANMFKPGVFDIDNLETFTTVGVSLFMILPVEGDSHQVFNMMHNAARKIADEFDGQILDGRRSVLTKQGLQQYFEKIRDFERRRRLSRA